MRVSVVTHWLFYYKKWWIITPYLHSFRDLYCALASVVSFLSSSPFNFSTLGIHSNLLAISLFFSISFPDLKYPCQIGERHHLLEMCLPFSVILGIMWVFLQNNPQSPKISLNNLVKTRAFLKLHTGIISELGIMIFIYLPFFAWWLMAVSSNLAVTECYFYNFWTLPPCYLFPGYVEQRHL